ncbi:MAG: hypothetical protein ABIT01_00995 [Thermoanaerobaculia bacterium]
MLKANPTAEDLDAEEAAAEKEADPQKRAIVLAMIAVERNERGLGNPQPALRKARAAASLVSDSAERAQLLTRIADA